MKSNVVVAIGGLPLSGKTTLGRRLAEVTGVHYVDIDAAPAQEENPYRSDESRLRERRRMTVAYTVLHAAVEANLAQSFPVIVSATYSRISNRTFLSDAALRGKGKLKTILCIFKDAPEEVERRVAYRLKLGAPGGCRSASHYFDDKGRYENPTAPHLVVHMDGGDEGVERAIKQALAYINNED